MTRLARFEETTVNEDVFGIAFTTVSDGRSLFLGRPSSVSVPVKRAKGLRCHGLMATPHREPSSTWLVIPSSVPTRLVHAVLLWT
jgi:hypothetical protein